ncbi:hypothetical protein MKZ38_000154 [Zalerion maritima]|uniref:NADPH-dependent FMN and FAD-containing oxidoreductase n=1 Tax=Zalerion maritima TaxID=339359 RepID=A0AAD5RZX1_9PEZI|nr:hypothetical protein MKZ38_000154 [Zalerion maritima]
MDDSAATQNGSSESGSMSAGAAVVEVKLPNRTVLILYGTETGNSQDLAEDLARRLRRIHFSPTLDEMDGVQLLTLLKYTLVVFVISTTGQGDMPRNSRSFWKSLLRKRLSPTCLERLRFAAFGLGDSKYPEFNFAIRKLHKRLYQLGAKPFLETGEADEQHPEGVDGTFLQWAEDLSNRAIQAHPLPEGIDPIPDNELLPPLYGLDLAPINMFPEIPEEDESQKSPWKMDEDGRLTFDFAPEPLEGEDVIRAHFLRTNESTSRIFRRDDHRVSDTQVDCGNILRDHPAAYGVLDPPPQQNSLWEHNIPIPQSWMATVTDNDRGTNFDHWQDVRSFGLELESKISTAKKKDVVPSIRAGNTLVIFPKNYAQDVQRVVELMGWEDYADRSVTFRSEKSDGSGNLMGIPKGLYPRMPSRTLRELLTHNLDITAIPKRSFFDQIWHFSSDEYHKGRLREFTDPKLRDELFDYTSRPRRTMLEVLEEFTSVKIPLQYAATIFPPIRGRHYSISDALVSPDYEKTEVRLLVALVKYKTVLQKTRHGLCSRYIENVQEGSRFRVQVGGTPWRVPLQVPVIAVATGTGVAPMSLFFKDRDQERGETNIAIGCQDLMFYGCRHPEKDNLITADNFEELNVLVRTAFSRFDGANSKYVQDAIRLYEGEVAELLQNNAHIVICGSSGRMPEAVKQAFVDVMLKRDLYKTEDAARNFLKPRVLEDTW